MTRKMMLIVGVAGLALTAPATAEKGGKGGDKPQPAEAQKADARQGGGQRAERPQRQAERPQRQERAQAQRAERPQRQDRPQMQRAERPQRAERQVQRAERPQRAERQMQRAERPQRVERQQRRVERQERRVERPQRIERQQRVERQERRVERRETARPQQKFGRQQQFAERRPVERMVDDRRDDRRALRTERLHNRGFRPVAALNPTRDMRQMKPFKVKFDRRAVSIGDRIGTDRSWSPVPTFVAGNYLDTRDYYHRYDNDFGTIYRIDRDDGFVRSQYPLFGGYGIGDPWPATYYSSYVPMGYQDYYYDTPEYYYRNDGYGIYQVDSSTQLITALVALLTGQGYGVGQMLPASYGAYNLPMDYRASYQDSDDSWYRYGDGFIYQVDPNSRRIAARYPIYTDNYDIGGAWPVAYPDYNVPYGYRSTYADTPQYQYRYANGGIYQVDPTNQVILALSALLSDDQFAVGQRMPSGYDSYNVPFDYRDRYADSDDEYYRYANGNVYQVDPRSGLIEEAFPIYA